LAQDGVGPVKITETLFYVNPEKYFPINGPSKPYVKNALGIDPSFDSYTEYEAVLNQIQNQTGEPFYKLSYEAWAWNKENKKTNYWVFQCNPLKFDVFTELKNNSVSNWSVDAHKDKIKNGDKVILWVTGNQAGCYALCETTSDVYEDTIELSHKGDEEKLTKRIDLKITHNLIDNPVLKPEVNQDERLSDLNAGNQGTNFTATKEEYEAFVELSESAGFDAKWERLQKVVQKIDDKQAVRKFFRTVGHVVNHFGLSSEDPIVYASSIKKYLQFTIGSRYVTSVEIKNGEVVQGFYVDNDYLGDLKEKLPTLKISDKAFDIKEGNMTWVYMQSGKVNIEDFFDGIVALADRGVKGQIKSQYRSTYSEQYNPWIIRVAQDDQLLEKLLNGEKMAEAVASPEIEYPLNTIFYGPPGTGKTYTTISRSAEIVSGRKISNYNEAKKIFHENHGDAIEFITFHQNYSYEDFIQGLRPDTENNQELTFERADGVFKKIADKALKNLDASRAPQTKKKTFQEVFNEFIQPLTEGEVEEIEVPMKRVSYYITAVTEKSIDFRKASGGTAHTLSINTLRKMYEAESVMEIQGLSSYYSPLLEILLDLGKTPGETEHVKRKNYVLIIDEINRANISRVFGELITLIEEDKRYGREFHIPAKLPSGESFSVPENLYIIGTMNTADKSIALLDIALRRRFDFEAMYPRYEINGEVVHDVDVLRKINERIKKLKGHDFQIGHSYFMKNQISLKQRMNRKVIPLLLEYFMNDEKEVREILTYAGLTVKEDSWPLEITGRV